MAWRIHFTPEDLTRTRVAGTLGPFAETLFGLAQLRCRSERTGPLARWRRTARARLTPQVRALAALVPNGTLEVDLWTLTGPAPTIEKGIEALLAIPSEPLLAEIEYVAQWHRLPASVWGVADPHGEGRRELAQAAYATYQLILEPHWNQVQAHLNAERVARGMVLLEGGVERLLTTLNPPLVRWRMPVLEVAVPGSADVHLGGRGLTLVPSVFVGARPNLLMNMADPAAAPMLVFPVSLDGIRDTGPADPDQPDDRALAALVGRTRAAALSRIADGCTTTELARDLSISPAGASQHASVLREAGLIVTQRRGSVVWHTLTPLGAAMLDPGAGVRL